MKTKKVIEELLVNNPHLKDSDNKLIATYWFRELKNKGLDPKEISAFDFLKLYADSNVSNAETIRRMRAKLQEEKPVLRGKVYNARKGIIQNKWRKELGYGEKNNK
jgi:hypothetical protein